MLLVSKIGRPWKVHVFPKNTFVIEVFDVEEKRQKIWNLVETLSGHLCRSVLIFMFLVWMVLIYWMNEFQYRVFSYPFFMAQVACVTCFNEHYVIMSAYHKWRLVSVLGGTIQYLKPPWKQRWGSHAVEMCIYSSTFCIWKFIDGSGWWHGSTLDCEWMGPGFDSSSRLIYARYYVENLFHPIHKCQLPHFFIFFPMSMTLYSTIFHIKIFIFRHWLCWNTKYSKC